MTTPRPRRPGSRTLRALCLLLALPLAAALPLGCGSEDPQRIVIDLAPWGMDFGTETDPPAEPEYYMYLVERAFYLSVLRLQRINGIYTLIASIAPPAAGGFSPYTVTVAEGAAGSVLFVTDITQDDQRLLAVDQSYAGDAGLDTLLLAATGGPPSQGFSDLGGVTAMALDEDTYRVFLADGNRVWIIDYAVGARTFSFGSPAYAAITGGCELAFRSPVGVAVDAAADPATRRPALYVVDKGRAALLRFSGIGGTNPEPVCDSALTEWDAGGDYLEEPRGVAVLSGGAASAEARVVVADKRKNPSGSGNDRVSVFSYAPLARAFEPQPVPAEFRFVPGAAPFGLAFDEQNRLWATYPEAKAIAGPPK